MWADLAGFILPGPLSGKVTVPLDLFRKQPSGQHSFALHSGARESSSEPGPGLGSISAEVLLGLGVWGASFTSGSVWECSSRALDLWLSQSGLFCLRDICVLSKELTLEFGSAKTLKEYQLEIVSFLLDQASEVVFFCLLSSLL